MDVTPFNSSTALCVWMSKLEKKRNCSGVILSHFTTEIYVLSIIKSKKNLPKFYLTRHRHMGPVIFFRGTHILGPFCPNHESTPKYPHQPWKRRRAARIRGGGVDVVVHLFPPARPKSIFQYRIRDTWDPTSTTGKNLPEFLTSAFFFFSRGGAQCPRPPAPPVSYTSVSRSVFNFMGGGGEMWYIKKQFQAKWLLSVQKGYVSGEM